MGIDISVGRFLTRQRGPVIVVKDGQATHFLGFTNGFPVGWVALPNGAFEKIMKKMGGEFDGSSTPDGLYVQSGKPSKLERIPDTPDEPTDFYFPLVQIVSSSQ